MSNIRHTHSNRYNSQWFGYIFQGGWQESLTRLPRNTSNLCAVPQENVIYIIGADISGTFDTETQTWADLPNLQVRASAKMYSSQTEWRIVARRKFKLSTHFLFWALFFFQQSDVGCEILTNEFNQSTLLAIGGSTGDQAWGLNLDKNQTNPIWINMEINIPSERPSGPTVRCADRKGWQKYVNSTPVDLYDVFFNPADPRGDHIGRSTGISNPAWHLPQVVPRVDQTTGSVPPQPTLPNC